MRSRAIRLSAIRLRAVRLITIRLRAIGLRDIRLRDVRLRAIGLQLVRIHLTVQRGGKRRVGIDMAHCVLIRASGLLFRGEVLQAVVAGVLPRGFAFSIPLAVQPLFGLLLHLLRKGCVVVELE